MISKAHFMIDDRTCDPIIDEFSNENLTGNVNELCKQTFSLPMTTLKVQSLQRVFFSTDLLLFGFLGKVLKFPNRLQQS